MDEERKSWEQMEQEPDLWYGRFVKYLRLGTKRSIRSVFLKETKQKQAKTSTNVGPGWCNAAKIWNWDERARAHDEWQRSEEDRIIAEERDKVLRSGFALQHKRIQLLDKMSRKLIAMTNDEEKIWIPETKTIMTTQGKDKSQEQVVEKVVFNAPLFTLIEKYQDSIAKEMGERVKKQELTGKDGADFVIELVGNGNPEEEEKGE